MKKIHGYFWLVVGVLLGLCGLFIVLIRNNVVAFERLNNLITAHEMPIFGKKLPPPSHIPTLKPVRLLFGGDVLLDRYIRQQALAYGYDYPFAELTSFLQQFDEVIVNLESPVTNFPSLSMTSEIGSRNNYLFTADYRFMDTLKKNSIEIVNLGNNHIHNFGEEGFNQTISYADEGKIAYFGVTPYVQEQTYLIKDINGLKFGFVNFNQFVDGSFVTTLEDIATVQQKGVDVLVAYTHWDNEYQKFPAKVTVQRAHALIDAGVDIVIGSHPHVIQSHEEYEGKQIYYSLGNFIFDQYFSDETKKGLLVEVVIDPKTLTIESIEHLVEMKPNGQTILLD